MARRVAHIKSFTFVLLPQIFFVSISWDEAVLLFGIFFERENLLVAFLGVYLVNAFLITAELVCPTTILMSIFSNMIKSAAVTASEWVLVMCFIFGVQLLVEFVVFKILKKLATTFKLKQRIGYIQNN
jgi:hypothetical protein